MSNDLKLLAVGLATVLSGLGAARSAEAGTIAVTAGLNSKTIVDNGGDDLDSTLGLISYSGTLGLWTFTVEGTTNPVIGSTTEPLMRLTIDADSTLVTSGETLTVTFVESGFGPSSTAVTATAAGEVAAGGRVTYRTSQGVSLLTQQIFAQGLFGTPLAASESDTMPTGASGYSLTQRVEIVHFTGNRSSTGTFTLSVPDGGSAAALLGSVLVGLGLLRRRFVAR